MADLLEASNAESFAETVLERNKINIVEDVKGRNIKKDPALFVTSRGRMGRNGISNAIRRPAMKLGLYDATSPDMENHFSSHCCRHWFTTYLDRAGMKRRHIQFLRGDIAGETIDIYIHNDLEKIRKEYLACIPRLGV